MIITISGLPGSGKTSVARLIAKNLGFKFYSMGDIVQKFTLQKKMTLPQFNRMRDKDPSWDLMIDVYQKSLVKDGKDFVMDGILSFFIFPDSLKVFLKVKPEIGARRIFKAKREDEPYKSFPEALKAVKERIKHDRARYKKIYNVNVHKESNFDFVVDTSELNTSQIVKAVLQFINKTR